MDPGAQDYDSAASGDAHVDSASTCPRCKQQTLHRVYYLPTVTATDPAITIALPTWANKTDAGPWAQGEWDRFFAAISKHEDNHKIKFVDHCAAAKALIEAFVKSKFIGEVCNTASSAGETKASELALKQFTDAQAKLDSDLAALATKIEADQKKYDADTKHGKTEGCIMDGDIPLLGAKP